MATIALLSRYGSKLTYDTGIEVNSIGLFFWKIPSMVGVLVRIKGGVWPRMCNMRVLWLI